MRWCFLLEIWFNAVQQLMIGARWSKQRSHAVTLRAATGGFHVKKTHPVWCMNLCSNEQLAEEIAVSLHLLKLLFCFRVCRSEVTTFK